MDRRQFVKLGLMATAALSIMGCDFFLEPGYDEKKYEEEQPGREKEEGPEKDEEDTDKKTDETEKDQQQEEQEKQKEEKDIKKEGKNEDHPIPRRTLGRTGLSVSIFSLGGAFTLSRGHMRTEAVKIINRALDLGVNYIDTAPTYAESESNIGEVMRNRRGETYLASKTLNRFYGDVMRQIEGSLKNLQTGYIDVYQLHGVHSEDDLRQVFGRDGAVKALEELKESGIIGYTGITAHKNYPVFLQAINEYDFDTALIPLNPGEVHTDSFAKNVLPVALQKKMGVIAMKVAAYGRLFRRGGIENMEQALRYVLTCHVNTAITGISNVDELEENINTARRFEPLSPGEMKHMEELAKPYQRDANFFKYDW